MVEMKQPCRFCARLTEKEQCPECQRHYDESGHYPRDVQWQRVPGQPRVVTRFCGDCGRELMTK